jgi:transposase, IS30 family
VPLRRPAVKKSGRRRPRFEQPMLTIGQRPFRPGDCSEAGHWEGDLIIGAGQRSAIATLVERKTRYTILVPLPGGHAAAPVADALISVFTTLPAGLRRTLTWDQGNEMFQHARIEQATGLQIYFADPHSPWQRGTNENTYWCKVGLPGLV